MMDVLAFVFLAWAVRRLGDIRDELAAIRNQLELK